MIQHKRQFSPQAMKHLLGRILDGQSEDSGDYIPDMRLREAVTEGPELSPAERRLIWTNPVVRHDFLRIRREIVRKVEDRLQEVEASLEVLPKAAAGGSEATTLRTPDFSLILHPPDSDSDWVVELWISDRIRSAGYAMTAFVLFDSEGRKWIFGHPDDHGRIIGPWLHPTVSPSLLLSQVGLVLRPA